MNFIFSVAIFRLSNVKIYFIIFFQIISICIPFNQKNIDKKLENQFYLSKNEAIIFVDGLVCPICTYGLKKKI